jgi:hypothetical protein
MRRAIELLPPELKPFFENYREELVLRSNDPDLWRSVPWDDDSNHFVDFGIPNTANRLSMNCLANGALPRRNSAPQT